MINNFHLLILFCLLIQKILANYLVFSPFESSVQETEDFQTHGLFHGELVVVSAASAGVYIYNSIDPKNPYLLSQIKGELTSAFSVSEYVENNEDFRQDFLHLLISNGENGACLCTVDFTDRDLSYSPEPKRHRVLNIKEIPQNKTINISQQESEQTKDSKKEDEEDQVDYFQQFKCKCIDFGYSVRHIRQLKDDLILVSGPGNVELAQVNLNNNSIDSLKKWELKGSNSYFIKDYKQWYIFMGNGAFINVLSIGKIIEQQDDILVCKKLIQEDVVKISQLQNENEHYIYVLDTNKGVFVSDISSLYKADSALDTLEESEITKELIIQARQIKSVAITKDQNYLIIGIRSKGIEIYDIKVRNKPYLSENLYTIGYANGLALNHDEQKLLFCNGDQMKIFEQMEPNLSVNFPNLFNGVQSNLVELDFGFKHSTPWRVKVSSDDKYIFVAAARNGLIIYDIQNDPLYPEYVDRVPCYDLKYPTDGCTLSHDDNFLFVGEGYSGVKIVNITDKGNIQELSRIDLNGDSDDIAVTQDDQFFIAGNGYTGMSLVNIKDRTNPIEKDIWENNKEGGSVENVLINGNDTYVFGSLRYYGFVVLELDLVNEKMKEISEFRTGMCEQMVLSFDEKHAFLSDGTYGITVVDIQNMKDIKKVSSVLLGGFPAKMRLYKYQDKFDYLLISQRDQELMAGVNVTDIAKPELVIKYQVEDEQSFDVECTGDKDFCFLVTDVGLRVLPMTTSIDIHHEFIEKKIVDGKVLQTQIFSDYLPVGKEIQIMLIPLRAGGKIKIKNMYYYDTFQLTPIPNYMSFNKATLTLDVKVNKLGIPIQKKIQSNILLVELIKKVDQEDFVSESTPVITWEQSGLLIEQCIKLGYLSRFQFVADEFKPDKELFYEQKITNPELYNEEIIQYIKQVLINSQIQVPLVLNFANSLIFTPEETGQEIIRSESNNLKIQIDILTKEKAEFVLIRYPGAMVDKYLFMMEGPKLVVLQSITQELLTQKYTENLEEIKYKITIDDKINHKQIHESNFSASNFFQLHKGVQKGKQSLQEQFDQAFDDSKVHITKEFQFQFSEFTFLSTASIPLKYDILIKRPGEEEYMKPEINFWLETNSNERIVMGTPPQDNYGDKIEVKVIATDGYSTSEQNFELKIVKIPWELIIYYIVAIGSPLMTVMGFYQFRGLLWGIFCKKRYKYGSFYVRDGEEFRMQMRMTLEPQKLFVPLFKYFLKEVKRQKIKLEDLMDPDSRQFNKQELIQVFKDVITRDPKMQIKASGYIPYLTYRPDQKEDGVHYQILQYHVYRHLLEKNKPSLHLYEKMKELLIQKTQNQNSWYLYCINITCQDISDAQQDFSSVKFIRNKLFEILVSVGNFKDKAKLQEFLDKFGKGLINAKNMHVRAPFYKNFGRESMSKNRVSVKLQKALDNDNQLFLIDNPELIQTMNQFQEHFNNKHINLMLVLHNLMGYILGTRGYKWFQYSEGESLHCDIRDIHLVKALIKDKNGCFGTAKYFPKIFQFLNIDYMGIPMISNSPLPNWLTYQYHHDVIELRGFWDPNEADEFMIRIENQNELIMKEFILKRLKKADVHNSRVSLTYNNLVPLDKKQLKELKDQGRHSTIENIIQRTGKKFQDIEEVTSSDNYSSEADQRRKQNNTIKENVREELQASISSYQDEEENCPSTRRETGKVCLNINSDNINSNRINENPLQAFRDGGGGLSSQQNMLNNSNRNIQSNNASTFNVDISSNNLLLMQKQQQKQINVDDIQINIDNNNQQQQEQLSSKTTNKEIQQPKLISNVSLEGGNYQGIRSDDNEQQQLSDRQEQSYRQLLSPKNNSKESFNLTPDKNKEISEKGSYNTNQININTNILQSSEENNTYNQTHHNLFKKKQSNTDLYMEESVKLNTESIMNKIEQQDSLNYVKNNNTNNNNKLQTNNIQEQKQVQNAQNNSEEDEDDDDDDDGNVDDDHTNMDNKKHNIQDYQNQAQFTVRTNTGDTNQNRILNSQSDQNNQQNNYDNLDYNVNPEEELTTFHK